MKSWTEDTTWKIMKPQYTKAVSTENSKVKLNLVLTKML